MNPCHGCLPGCALSKSDDCTRQRQTCCETGTQSRESFVTVPRSTGVVSQKIVWLPKAIGESGFSVPLVSQKQTRRYAGAEFPRHARESSPTTRALCSSLYRRASSLTSPSYFFPFTLFSFLNPRSSCACKLSLCAVTAVLSGREGPFGPTQIPLSAWHVGDLQSTQTVYSSGCKPSLRCPVS